MRVFRYAIPVVIGAAILAAVWLSVSAKDSASVSETSGAAGDDEASSANRRVDVSSSGPHPSIAVEGRTYEFGVMPTSEEGRHTFVVRNEGDAPLELAKQWTTCQFTVNGGSQCEVPPGGSAEVEMVWTHDKPSDKIESYAVLSTNDPNRRYLWLRARGRVVNYYDYSPLGAWDVGHVTGSKAGEVTGKLLTSWADTMNILKVESPSPLLQATFEPLDETQLAKFDAKAGYTVTVSRAASMTVSPIQELLILHTDVPGRPQAKIEVSGVCTGPYQFMPPATGKWLHQQLALHLGQFPASVGGKAAIPVIVTDLGDQELQIVSTQCDVDFLQVRLEKNPSSQTTDRQFYRLIVEVPPGAPASSWPLDNGIRLVIETNHPLSAEIPLRVHFVSL